MIKITVDDMLRNRFHHFHESVELCDEAGKVLARLTPVFDPSEYEPCEPQISEEELRRREKSDKWYTTAEVLAHLRNLETH